MELLVISFVAGILTVLAPCILPLLPVVIGGSSLHGQDKNSRRSILHPVIIVASLVVSVVIFTLLLKATTLLLGISSEIWSIASGCVIFLFGVNLLFPGLWERVSINSGLQAKSNQLLARSQSKNAIKKDVLLGAALGPVFNSCSPTYALIVAAILPVSFVEGGVYLLAYSSGLGVVLLLISIFGRVLVDKLKWASNPQGAFHKVIGVILVSVGLAIMLSYDKKVQSFVLDQGWYDPVSQLEQSLR